MALSAGDRLGPYEVIGVIGAGGMGEVYRARDPRLNREVAVKVMRTGLDDAEQLRRFEQEARAAGALNHPNILAVHDVGQQDGVPFVVTELLEGRTLRALIANGALPPRKAVEIAIQIAHGLGAAHARGIVHRDLKPENVLVTEDGHSKILDFGLAKLVRAEAGPTDATGSVHGVGTTPGTVMGTVGYMAPEQVRAGATDARTDIFALGAVLYEMICGRRAFTGETPAETMTAILKHDPPDLSAQDPRISPGLDRVVRRCLEKRPEDRFHSARDLAYALDAVSVSSGIGAAPALGGAPSRRRAVIGAVVGIALAAVAAAAWWLVAVASRQPDIRFEQVTYEDGHVRGARFTPDGRSVVFAAAWAGAPPRLFARRGDSKDAEPVGPDAAILFAISKDGELAIGLDPIFRSLDGELATLARMPLGGAAPRPLTDRVTAADWAPDGSALAMVRDVAGRTTVEFPQGKVLFETAGWIEALRFSPRGDRLAFMHHPRRGSLGATLTVVDLGGRVTEVGGPGDFLGGSLAWTPGGEILVGSGGRVRTTTLRGRERVLLTLPGTTEFHDRAADGRLLVVVVDARIGTAGRPTRATRDRDLTWRDFSWAVAVSNDGGTVLMATDSGGALREVDTGRVTFLGGGEAWDLSPDGRWALATTSVEGDERLMVVPIGTGETRYLSNRDPVRWAAWFPDGRRIAYSTAAGSQAVKLWIRSLDDDEPGLVPAPGARFGILAVSPDGREVVAPGAEHRFWAYPVSGGSPRSIPGLGDGDQPIRWATEGRLYFFHDGEIPLRIRAVDLTSGRLEVVREIVPSEPAGIVFFQPVLSANAQHCWYTYHRRLSRTYVVSGVE